MAAGLPFLKLSALLVKTISKPVGAFFRAQSQKEPRMADFFVSVGQRMHYVQSRINVVASGYKFVGVKPLATEQALGDGVTTMSELLVLSISASIVIYEFQKSQVKDKIKNDALAAEKAHQRFLLESRFQAIESRLEHIEDLLRKAEPPTPTPSSSSSSSPSSSWFGLGTFLVTGRGSGAPAKPTHAAGALEDGKAEKERA
jgi:hypothetical protein